MLELSVVQHSRLVEVSRSIDPPILHGANTAKSFYGHVGIFIFHEVADRAVSLKL